MRVALVQHDIIWENPGANFLKLAPMINTAASTGSRFIILPEMFATGFTMNSRSVAEPIDGQCATFLATMAATHGCYVGGTFACARSPSLPLGGLSNASQEALPTNTFLVAAPDGTHTRYDKLHPFSYAREHEAYAAGRSTSTMTIDDVRVSLFVCYDLRFANVMWDLAEHTDLYVFPSNWPDSRRHHWKSLLVARAIENQAYVAGVNRVGTHGSLTYVGDSMIVDPQGEVLAHASDRETIVYADVDSNVVARTRASFPFLQDRRI